MSPSLASLSAMRVCEEPPTCRSSTFTQDVLESIRHATKVARSFEELPKKRASIVPCIVLDGAVHSPAQGESSKHSPKRSKPVAASCSVTSELDTLSNSNETIAAVAAREPPAWPSKLSSETDSGSVPLGDRGGIAAARAGTCRPGAPLETMQNAQQIAAALRDLTVQPTVAEGLHLAQAAIKPADGRCSTPTALVELQTAISTLQCDTAPIPVHKFLPPIKVSFGTSYVCVAIAPKAVKCGSPRVSDPTNLMM